ncbi:MAG: GH36-type glycosyl hydrolase domain-containing protein [Desulfitobacteriaceae bacterium]
MKLSTALNLTDEKPLKDIVLNHDELLHHAFEISHFHAQSGFGKKRLSLVPRVLENARFLQKAHGKVTEYVQRTKDMVPAAEWFLDNYYLLKDLSQEIQTNLPRKYERQLPRLTSGVFQGYPRVYALMVELIEHTDSLLQGESLKDFVNTYQEQVPLSSGELWAIPIMLKITILENLRRLVEQVLEIQSERDDAEKWLAPFRYAEYTHEEWEEVLESAVRPVAYSAAFGERLLKRIREMGLDGLPILHWLDRSVARQDTTIESLAKLAHQQQAACQVSMGHAITSLRFLGAEDWPRFFEEISLVEKVLQTDPGSVYSQMDFESRDVYRHEVEKLGRRFNVPETLVARKVLEYSKVAHELPANHVGYYLLGKGRQVLEQDLEKEWGVIGNSWFRFRRLVKQRPLTVYFTGASIILIVLYSLLYAYAVRTGALNLGMWLTVFFTALIPLSSIALPLINWIVTQIIPPSFLAKLDLRGGIPADLRTMVVIPTLLTNVTRVDELLEQLEVYHLANQDSHLHFAILGDYVDAMEETLPEDQEVLEATVKGVEALNGKYGSGTFYLFHRHRLWNPKEGTWLGWERKRGKLVEFNRLLRRSGPTSYSTQIGDLSFLSSVRYVITLDADTQLPRGTAMKLIGAIAHPLQEARLSPDGHRVVEGYGVLQPRIGVSVSSASASFFAKVFSGKVGIDPYTAAISDVYQDLFGEGIFTGKGIYDVDIFHRMTGDVFSENTILSHDLIEGLHARTGLVTDIELIDSYPAKYHAHARRLHRWVRGDWQIARWLFQPLSVISKWKILDNLRRSLNAPFGFLLLALGFTILPGEPWVWAAIILAELLLPTVLCLVSLAFGPESKKADLSQEVQNGLVQSLIQLVLLPFTAFIMVDAIIKSLYRQFISHKHLLEWEAAADTERRLDTSLKTSWSHMWQVWLFVFVTTALVAVINPTRLPRFSPLFVLWLSSPWVAYKISLPFRLKRDALSAEEQAELRLYARRIWAFFEEYVGTDDNWLPPDNVQIDPPNGIAHRTSPTNMGLALLANLAARDLGYISLKKLYERVENTLTSMEGLERWNGHLYNWYDTIEKNPLLPLYVSTVDSGNLVLYLLALLQGLEETLDSPVLDGRLANGLKDTYDLCLAETAKFTAHERASEDLPEGKQDARLSFSDKAFEEALDLILGASEPERDFNPWLNLLTQWTAGRERAEGGDDEIDYWVRRLSEMLQDLGRELEQFYPWLSQVASLEADDLNLLYEIKPTHSPRELRELYARLLAEGSDHLQQLCRQALENIDPLLQQVKNLHERLQTMAMVMDFRPLYDEQRQLFSIGYRIHDGALDKSYYDLLASEARQASFIAIAKGDIPQSHWFRLGRSLTQVKGHRGLVSWSGTMFEFLMPLLVMRNYEGTLLDETYRSVVQVQKLYGEEHNIPWGISESGFYAFDAQLNYQYKAFGVPGLGLKRGLIQDLVVSPYSSFLGLMVMPRESTENLRMMQEIGFGGRYGLYEAIEYTPERLPAGEDFRVVKSFMTHHQGMSFLALTNTLEDNALQRRLHANTVVQSSELLLQERIPGKTKLISQMEEKLAAFEVTHAPGSEGKRTITLTTAETSMPVVHFISNGHYSVMLSNAGSGYSRWGDISISRWREDVTRDQWGTYFYIQNLNSGNTWSATYQPWGDAGGNYKAVYAPDKVEFNRKDGNITTRTEIVVSPEDPVEIRRISLTNHSLHSRTLEVTSYFEVVLAQANDDLAHPAFSNLFIQTEFTHQALLASRRPRRDDQTRLWLMHTVALEGEAVGALQYETDRARFIGRGRTPARPQAMEPSQPLSNTIGPVLDPILSLRQRILVQPGQTVKVSFAIGVAESREEVIRLAEKYRNPAAVNRAHELAWTHSQMELRHLNLTPAEANEALSLAAHLVFTSPCRRDYQEALANNVKGQASLWPYAISGDLPIVLLRVKQFPDLDFVREFLQVHEYWHLKGLISDLIILNEDESGYVQSLQDTLRDLVAVGYGRELMNRPGGVFLIQKKLLPPKDLTLLFTAARVVFTGQGGSCAVQLRKKAKTFFIEVSSMRAIGDPKRRPEEEGVVDPAHMASSQLLYANGYGGFDQEAREYVIELSRGINTPLPWLNVVANPKFGFQISESGSGYTWSQNSRENKLTSWSNDPVQDPPGEALYVRDEISGEFWSVTPAPIRETGRYIIRHGQGYSIFTHAGHGLAQEILFFVPLDDPVKIIRLTFRNQSPAERRLTATYYAETVLGVAREWTAPYLVTEYVREEEALLIHNTYQEEFAGRRAFLGGYGAKVATYTGDRTEFIGRNRDLRDPAGMETDRLSGATGAGLDPCAVLQLEFSLKPGEEKILYFYLGEAGDREAVGGILRQYRDPSRVEEALNEVKGFWRRLTGTVQIETPDKSMDLLVNSWLLYQTMVCRLWARSAFYQSGGAYGFRDQLQDVMALAVAAPEWTRGQILKHCAHQFLEGDVQHWWHAEKGKGIRTKFSDDYLWLPFVTADYLEHTGDYDILNEKVPFIEDALLGEDDDERYSIPLVSQEDGSVYEHCIRSIERGLRFGAHGLPLIGSGDWNDGFNRIGRQGKGESVWLGWFLYLTLQRFAAVCRDRLDDERAERYRLIAHQLQEHLERYGWDGGWYRRAYFDDGTPLGSSRNEECQIDAIAQSWAIISGAAKPSRVQDAMLALEHYLWHRDEGILLLLTPPFDQSSLNPGYIKGYVPGVRENGGQYTHGAIWASLAFSMMGDGDKAYELFQMLNPINHSRTAGEVARYKTEPYVMAADVYAISPHAGRGGWSWYTGAAGWTYQTALEGILGLLVAADKLTFNPCIPRHWPGFRIEYKYKNTIYKIEVENSSGNTHGVKELFLNGQKKSGSSIGLVDDGKVHEVKVRL